MPDNGYSDSYQNEICCIFIRLTARGHGMPSSRPLFFYLSGTMDNICKIMFTCEPFKAKFPVTYI